MEKIALLQRYFGHKAFRPLQEEVIDAILARRDVLMVLPTGGGKSLCYQLPTLMTEGVTVVISPLLALMHDQVTALRQAGIAAAMLSSMQTIDEVRKIEAALLRGEIKLLYVAPERLGNAYFTGLLSRLRLNFFVVDEAHCVSEWGHEFREDYRKLSLLKTRFSSVPIAAFTATATEAVERDIVSQLRLIDPVRVRGPLFRRNLTVHVRHRIKEGKEQLLAFLDAHKGEAGIVYTLSRNGAESLAHFLQTKGYKAVAYHAGLTTETKNEAYRAFVNDEVDIVVATIAFGMGIDKSNIRYVVHMRMPKTPENYYQEIGRAGRDGLEAETLLLFSASDIVQQRRFIEELPDTPYRMQVLKKLSAMARYCESETCRHRYIAAYFGDTIAPCGNACDNCLSPDAERIDVTEAAQKLLAAVYRTRQRFGLHYVVDVLRGSNERKIRDNGHDTLSVYGIGKEYTKAQWLSIGDRLLETGALDIGKHRTYRLTSFGAEVLKGIYPVTMRKTRLEIKPMATTTRKTPLLSDEEEDVFRRLRALRSELAAEHGVPPYVIFSDKTLRELAAHRPKSKEEMLAVHGIGEVKFERYGEMFLVLLTETC